MSNKKQNLTKIAIAVLVVLLAASAYVSAHPTETRRWDETGRMHERITGEDWEEHYKEVHGEEYDEDDHPCHGTPN